MVDFDLEAFRITPDQKLEVRSPSEKERKRGNYWVQFPEVWTKRLIQANGSTYRLAIYLLRRRRILNTHTITVANGALKLEGVGREGKAKAIEELVEAGLVTVEHRDRKSPIVTLLPVR